MDGLIGGAVLGAFASVGLEKLIAEVKAVSGFKAVSEELASTMEDLLPIVIDIESLQGNEELKSLKVTIAKAEVLVKKCSGVKRWEVFDKAKCTKKVWKIQKEMVSFCQVQLQLLQHRNQLQSKANMKKLDIMMKDIDYNLEIVTQKIDLLREEMSKYHQILMEKLEIATEKLDLLIAAPINRDICLVPKLGKAPIESDWPQKKVFDDSVVKEEEEEKRTDITDRGDAREVKSTDSVSLGLGSIGGDLVSKDAMLIITEAKKFKSFKPLSNDLVLTMEKILLITEKIDELGLGAEELKELKDTIERARVLVHKFPSVWFYQKARYTREIEGINKDLLKFCRIDLQLLQYRNQLKFLGLAGDLANKVDDLSNRREDFGVLCSVPKVDRVLVGLDWPLMELKKRVLDNDVVNLVVSAPPGCGKTTLVTELCHDANIKGMFKHIFFNVVSSAPNFRKLVQNLLQHNGVDPPTCVDDNQAINSLQKLLKKLREGGPILMVLDDVWHGAESLLEKFKSIDLPGYKILVTSRVEFLSFGPTFELKPLNDEVARALLIECAPQPDEASQAEYDFYLEKILKRCNGFPLVIKVVGSSLKGNPKYVWKGQVDGWSQGATIIGEHASVLECLEPSFSALESNLKECFLDMGLFLEDQKIRASIIIDIWVELYDKGVNPCMKYLEDLASHSLLTLVPLGRKEHDEGFYNEFLVTQHCILRELAIHQSESDTVLERKRVNLEIRENNFPEWCSNPEHPTINASLLSISTDDLFSSNWVEMECPNVEALVLNISSSEYVLPKFISTMKKLKVVIIINHSYNQARLHNVSCLSSLPNLKRIRLENVSHCNATTV